jgi:hypothetical protein
MSIKQAIADLDDSERREILEFILEGVSTPSFGSMPRKETELLMLEALVKVRYLDADPTLYQLTQRLRVTRAKSRSLIYERDLRRLDAAKLDQLLQSAITKPLIQKQGDLFCLEIENPLLTDHLKYKLGRLGHATDVSFSPSIVKLTLDVFNALIVDLIPTERRAAIKAALVAAGAADESFSGLIRGVLVRLGGRFADSAGEALGENISDYLAPLFSGAGSEITSRISNLFPGVT